MIEPIAPVRRAEGIAAYRWQEHRWVQTGRYERVVPLMPTARAVAFPWPILAWIAALVVIVALIAANAGPTITPVRADPAPTAPQPAVNSEAPQVRYEPIVLTGVGPAELPVAIPAGAVATLTLDHTGTGPFIVWANPADAATKRLITNTIGTWSGTTLIPGSTTALAITADGPWTLTIAAPLDAPTFTGSAEGNGSRVLRTTSGTLTFTHNGAGLTAVWFYPDASPDGHLLTTLSGTRSAPVTIGDGLLVVDGTGDWTLTRP